MEGVRFMRGRGERRFGGRRFSGGETGEGGVTKRASVGGGGARGFGGREGGGRGKRFSGGRTEDGTGPGGCLAEDGGKTQFPAKDQARPSFPEKNGHSSERSSGEKRADFKRSAGPHPEPEKGGQKGASGSRGNRDHLENGTGGFPRGALEGKEGSKSALGVSSTEASEYCKSRNSSQNPSPLGGSVQEKQGSEPQFKDDSRRSSSYFRSKKGYYQNQGGWKKKGPGELSALRVLPPPSDSNPSSQEVRGKASECTEQPDPEYGPSSSGKTMGFDGNPSPELALPPTPPTESETAPKEQESNSGTAEPNASSAPEDVKNAIFIAGFLDWMKERQNEALQWLKEHGKLPQEKVESTKNHSGGNARFAHKEPRSRQEHLERKSVHSARKQCFRSAQAETEAAPLRELYCPSPNGDHPAFAEVESGPPLRGPEKKKSPGEVPLPGPRRGFNDHQRYRFGLNQKLEPAANYGGFQDKTGAETKPRAMFGVRFGSGPERGADEAGNLELQPGQDCASAKHRNYRHRKQPYKRDNAIVENC
ncbi:hypothetical protein HWI79_1605 [Cryptosporidium felis]|nr:hypothetical protein HWI79_1605 [Cryptosporidium felis]